jgi:ferredoxin-NADP reductase
MDITYPRYSKVIQPINELQSSLIAQFKERLFTVAPSSDINSSSPHIVATVARIEQETPNAKSYFFKSSIPLANFGAGSHINFQFDIDHKPVNRTYTVSSAPKPQLKKQTITEFSITVKRINNGHVSNWLFDHLKTGDSVLISQAQGTFTLPYQPAGKLLLLSAGSGITPLMSMLRYLSKAGNKSDIAFINYAQSLEEVIFSKEITELTNDCSNMSSHLIPEQQSDNRVKAIGDSILTGRINKKQLLKLVPDILDRHVYLCGPQAFMKATGQILDDIDFDPTHLHLENFSVDIDPLALNHSTEITFSSTNRAVLSSPSNTILQEAETAGLNPASACRTGICKTCRCQKKSGTTLNILTGEESSAENEYILPCISIAKTPTIIEL